MAFPSLKPNTRDFSGLLVYCPESLNDVTHLIQLTLSGAEASGQFTWGTEKSLFTLQRGCCQVPPLPRPVQLRIFVGQEEILCVSFRRGTFSDNCTGKGRFTEEPGPSKALKSWLAFGKLAAFGFLE